MKRPHSPVYMKNSEVFKFLIIRLAVLGKIKGCATDKSDDLLQYPFHPLGTTVAHKDPSHSAKTAGSIIQLNSNTHAPYISCLFMK